MHQPDFDLFAKVITMEANNEDAVQTLRWFDIFFLKSRSSRICLGWNTLKCLFFLFSGGSCPVSAVDRTLVHPSTLMEPVDKHLLMVPRISRRWNAWFLILPVFQIFPELIVFFVPLSGGCMGARDDLELFWMSWIVLEIVYWWKSFTGDDFHGVV